MTLETIIESEGRKSASKLLRDQLRDADGGLQTITVRHREGADNLRAHRQKLASTEDAVLVDYRGLLHRNCKNWR